MRGLEIILPHLILRARRNLPLTGGPTELAGAERSLARYPLYRKIARLLTQGLPLSAALAKAGLSSPFQLRLVEVGESSGQLATALGLLADHYPLANRFRHQLTGIGLYLLVVSAFFLAFIGYYSFNFVQVHQAVVQPGGTGLGTGAAEPWVFTVFFWLGRTGIIPWLAGGLILAFILARLLGGPALGERILLGLPLIGLNLRRVISLEMATLYSIALGLGRPPAQALAEATDGLGPGRLKAAWQRVGADLENGRPWAEALAAQPLLADLPFTQFLALDLPGPEARVLLTDLTGFWHQYLTRNLPRDLDRFFRWGVVGCGLMVGVGLTWVFQAIIQAYSWLGAW